MLLRRNAPAVSRGGAFLCLVTTDEGDAFSGAGNVDPAALVVNRKFSGRHEAERIQDAGPAAGAVVNDQTAGDREAGETNLEEAIAG